MGGVRDPNDCNQLLWFSCGNGIQEAVRARTHARTRAQHVAILAAGRTLRQDIGGWCTGGVLLQPRAVDGALSTQIDTVFLAACLRRTNVLDVGCTRATGDAMASCRTRGLLGGVLQWMRVFGMHGLSLQARTIIMHTGLPLCLFARSRGYSCWRAQVPSSMAPAFGTGARKHAREIVCALEMAAYTLKYLPTPMDALPPMCRTPRDKPCQQSSATCNPN